MPPEQIEGPLDVVDLGFDIGAHGKPSRQLRECPRSSGGFTENSPEKQGGPMLLSRPAKRL
jgi:hypothetical protein